MRCLRKIMSTLLIQNATLVNEGREFKAHLKIEGDRIAAIGSDLVPGPQDAVLDATGLHLLPGLIDDQVHFREPGLTQKACIASEIPSSCSRGHHLLFGNATPNHKR